MCLEYGLADLGYLQVGLRYICKLSRESSTLKGSVDEIRSNRSFLQGERRKNPSLHCIKNEVSVKVFFSKCDQIRRNFEEITE